VPTSGTKDAGEPLKAAGGPGQLSGEDGGEVGGEKANGKGEDPSQEYESANESGEKNTGAGGAGAGEEGEAGEEGTGGGGDEDDGESSGGDDKAEMEVGVQHATVELNEKGECKRDPEFWAPPLKLPTGGAVYYLERFKEAVEKGSKEGKGPIADEVIEPPAFLKPRKVGTQTHPARWAQMGHTEAENFLMHLRRFYLSISMREASPPNTPERAADWQRDVNKSRLYVQQTILGCFASYQEDMKLRQGQAQPNKKVTSDLSEAFEFYRRATLSPATNTPSTQNDGTNPQNSEVCPNPTMEKELQGVSQVRLQADGHWQAHVINRFGTDWVKALLGTAPVQYLTPAERAQRAWKLKPPSEGAGAKLQKAKGTKATEGRVTQQALTEAVGQTAVRQALEGRLVVAEQLLATLDTEQAAGRGEKEGGERGSRRESTVEKGARKGKRPAPTAEEVVREGAKRKRKAETGKKAATGVKKSAAMECLPMEETAAGGQSAAGEQVAPVLEAREGEKAATGVEKSAGKVCPPREETAGLQSSVGVVIAPAGEV
jgi:hypothetical protein